MADRPISAFNTYTVTINGQMLVLDTTTSTTKRIVLSDMADYILDGTVSIIDGGDHQTVYLANQDMTGGNATTP